MVSLSGGKPTQYGIYKSLKFITPDSFYMQVIFVNLCSALIWPCKYTHWYNITSSSTELFSVLHVFTPVVSHIEVTILTDYRVGT